MRTTKSTIPGCRRKPRVWVGFCLLFLAGLSIPAQDLPGLCSNRVAVERVYYQHRTGEKPPFEETLPPATLEKLVRLELRKESALREHYGVLITPTLLAAEVRRIDSTTRAPEVLAEIKAALGNDPAKFASTVAMPIVVDRLLRQKFENDDALHLSNRRACETVRSNLLAAKTGGANAARLVAQLKRSAAGNVTETSFQLGARPAPTNALRPDELEARKQFGPEARRLSPPTGARWDHEPYFDDLPAPLSQILAAQLRKPGDVSAVIETPETFLLYVAAAKSATSLSVACLALPKLSLEQWLESQAATP